MTILSASLLILLVAVTFTESGKRLRFKGKKDVVFILDSSGSVGTADFKEMKNFAKYETYLYKLGKKATQFGLDLFSTTVTTEIKLKDNNRCGRCLRNEINSVNYKGGKTNTFFALDHARFNSFSASYGARTGVPKVAIVMTDGKSQGKDKTCDSAKDLRNSGVTIMVIPIGDKVDKKEIDCMASSKSFILPVKRFAGLRNRVFRNRIAKKVFAVKLPASIGERGSSG
ncbi:von Willebrand factor A domain-containing protein 2-like [Mytilus edulis]|uniref:von Willebrand factor A domain-containing protein 2-like n=1 Tax=Mytilus edulis TaxID=6550 RepID=UPI0039EE59D9